MLIGWRVEPVVEQSENHLRDVAPALQIILEPHVSLGEGLMGQCLWCQDAHLSTDLRKQPDGPVGEQTALG